MIPDRFSLKSKSMSPLAGNSRFSHEETRRDTKGKVDHFPVVKMSYFLKW